MKDITIQELVKEIRTLPECKDADVYAAYRSWGNNDNAWRVEIHRKGYNFNHAIGETLDSCFRRLKEEIGK